MKSVFIPNESFESKYEVKSINNYLYKHANILLEDIDDQTEIWIIGNKDKDFFTNQTVQAFEEDRVLDPLDNLPVPRYRQIHHIAVINHKYGPNSQLNAEIIYANCDHEVAEFVAMVINILKSTYPRNGSDKKLKIVKDLRGNDNKGAVLSAR